jgi:5-methylcytosine-specific restriction enzyme subunit McrC
MRKTTTLFEHEYTNNFNWSDSEAVKLTALNKSLGADILTPRFRSGKRELRAAQYVGVVRFANKTVQILPKIYRSENYSGDEREAVVREATENLLYLLAYAGKFSIKENEITALSRQSSDWFEILTRIFASHLTTEWERGVPRSYRIVESELSILKGKWKLNEQLRRPLTKHKFSVEYDEFSVDNKLNRVFRFVVERLWKLTRDGKNRQALGDLRVMMDDVVLVNHLTAKDASPSLLSRMNSRFAPLLNLARLFLDDSALRLHAGDTDSFAFVFDMNSLFEEFLIEFIRRHRLEILPEELQNCDVLPQTRGATRHLADREEKAVFLLKPDAAFKNEDGQFPLLLDAKYKKLNEQDLRVGVSQSDFYQMHAYANRYACPRILLIYPQTSEMKNNLRVRFRLQASAVIIQAATLNLHLRICKQTERDKLVAELKEIFRGE